MANHPSALKRMQQNERKRLRNMSFRSKTKTAVKKFLGSVEEKTQDAAELLSFRDQMEGDRRLARGFRPVDLDDPAAGHAPYPDRQVESDRAGGDHLKAADRGRLP